MNELTLTYPLCIARGGRGPTVFTTPSRFLNEIDESLFERGEIESDTGRRGQAIPGRAIAGRPQGLNAAGDIDDGRGRSSGGLVMTRLDRGWPSFVLAVVVGDAARRARAADDAASRPRPLPHPGRGRGDRARRAAGRAEDGQPDPVRHRQQRHRGVRRAGPVRPQGLLHVTSHGYEVAKDGFGYRGKALRGHRGRLGADRDPAAATSPSGSTASRARASIATAS